MIPRMRVDSQLASKDAAPRLRLAERVGVEESADPTPASIERVLAEARRTLGRLRADRAMLEQRLAASGRVDPIREIRGRSAIDEAIDHTVAMIRRLEQVLERTPSEG